MAWIDTLPEDQWEGDLAALYPKVVDKTEDRVDNIMQIHSLDPRAMAGHLAIYESAMAGTRSLRKVERELVAIVVSDINGCSY